MKMEELNSKSSTTTFRNISRNHHHVTFFSLTLSGHHRWRGGDKHTTEKILVKAQHAEIQEVPAEAVPNAFTCRGVGGRDAIFKKATRIFQLFGGIYISKAQMSVFVNFGFACLCYFLVMFLISLHL